MGRPVLKKKSDEVAAKPMGPLHVRLRPQSLSSVIGQDNVTSSLMAMIKAGRVPHTFLLTGPSGTGKTTIARLIAQYQHCSVIEVDSAIYSGIDKMRELLMGAQYAAMGAKRRKCYILDEVQSLSKATWQTLLKATEEPEEHVFWVLCTTEPEKVPKTIRTRCHAYDLKPVHWETIAEYLAAVVEQEKLSVDDGFIEMAANRAQGSVRQALVYLSMLDGVTEEAQALSLLDQVDDGEDSLPIELARMLVSGKGGLLAAIEIVKRFEGQNMESVRIVVSRYAAAVMLNAKNANAAGMSANILSAFSTPFNASEGNAPLLLALAQFYSE